VPQGALRRRVLEANGDHGLARALDCGDKQPAEAGPGRRRARDSQAGIATTGLSVEQGAERRLPAGAERGDSERSEQLLARVPRHVEQRVDFGDGHLFRSGGDLDDLVTRLNLALFEHAEVEAGAAVAGLIPQARLKTYPDAAHGFLFQHHAEFAADVDAFLASA
jgi:pimeloyl-ACP methyl ester carboxylesterase